MPNPKQIQINIPNPCSQPWDEMTPCGQARFCNHCQKTVIDFTAWSDAALYGFFAKNEGDVCGRFLASQTGRDIAIPPQPHSRLYRMMVALGLTLVCVQPVNGFAQNKPPLVSEVGSSGKPKAEPDAISNSMGVITGTVLDEKKEPLLSATVQVFQGGILKVGSVTDFDGNYVIKPLEPGFYDVLVSFTGYDSVKVTKVIVRPGQSAKQDFIMKAATNVLISITVQGAYISSSRGENSYLKKNTSDQIKPILVIPIIDEKNDSGEYPKDYTIITGGIPGTLGDIPSKKKHRKWHRNR